MLIDALFDRLASRFRHSTQRQHYDEFSSTPNRTKTGLPKRKPRDRGFGLFNGASNFILSHPTFNIDRSQQTIQNFAAGKPVLERIVPYADLDAAMDSSARFPPPSCHPGTRLKIGDWLFNWLINHQRQWNMIWLHGPAGTGKSAVAQTFAELCAVHGRLGASFFFSWPNNRNKPNTVIPSLVYQLAVSLPHYKSLVTAQLANDPELLRKTRRAQFKKLIVEPFLRLQTQKRNRIQEPLVVILDGLDECREEDAQRDIVEMISELVLLQPDFPLVWLICSRPEAHLKYLFSRADFTVSCGRKDLVIDAESIADVDLYLRDGLAGIQDHFWDITGPTWPPEEQFTELSGKACGHFAFASTALRYIGDPIFAAPMARLDGLLSFLAYIRVGSSNPLEALDAVYTRILLNVPHDVLSPLKQILGFCLYLGFEGRTPFSASTICNLFYIDQGTFYRALRRLHSVIDVPSPEVASRKNLRFYHASFTDYLRDHRRSGQFAIERGDFFIPNFAKSCLSWYNTDLVFFHTADAPVFDSTHSHGILPGLTWVSDDDTAYISYSVAFCAGLYCWFACLWSNQWDEALFSQIQRFSFRYIQQAGHSWHPFMNKLWERDPLNDIIRTEPRNEVDLRLLEYLKSMIEPALKCRPATFPLPDLDHDAAIGGEYFLLGQDSEAIVCWVTGHKREEDWFGVLNCNEAPSKERIEAYQAWLVEGRDVEIV